MLTHTHTHTHTHRVVNGVKDLAEMDAIFTIMIFTCTYINVLCELVATCTGGSPSSRHSVYVVCVQVGIGHSRKHQL